jgi:hypothetical protein
MLWPYIHNVPGCKNRFCAAILFSKYENKDQVMTQMVA